MNLKTSKQKITSFLLIVFILIIAAGLRLLNVNWDADQHLHPDERFLTMVANDIKMPQTFLEYLDPERSALNPANHNYNFFVYGNFPVILNKFVAQIFNNDNYHSLAIQGRIISAVLEMSIVILVFHLAYLLSKKYQLSAQFKYWAALGYATFVLSIQQAHFYTVDSFVNFFCFLSVYAAWRWQEIQQNSENIKQAIKLLSISAISFGLAMASKINAIYCMPLIGWLLINQSINFKNFNLKKSLKKILPNLILFGIISYVTLRLANPYFFRSQTWLDPRPHENFLKNIEELKALNDPETWYPPGLQWRKTKPIWFAVKNTFIFGVGLAHSIFVFVGLIYLIYSLIKKKNNINLNLIIFALWLVGFFLYQSTRYTKTNRYFLILYPYFALLFALGLEKLSEIIKKNTLKFIFMFNSVCLGAVAIWPLMFISIYLQPHTRIQASRWIYQNVPQKSLILTEHWDDALPVSLAGMKRNYEFKELPVFGQDTAQKWQEMDQLLKQADYYILSSNRGWGSIMPNEDRYPQMSYFYEQLFAENTPYKKVAEFNSFPSLEYLGIPLTLDDSWAEEAFSVYDHPQVMVFEKKNQ